MRELRSAACVLAAILGSGCVTAHAQISEGIASSGKTIKATKTRLAVKPAHAVSSVKNARKPAVKPGTQPSMQRVGGGKAGSILLRANPSGMSVSLHEGTVSPGAGNPGGMAGMKSASAEAGVPGFPTPVATMAAGPAPEANSGSLGALGKRKVTLETDRTEPWDAILNLLRNAGVNYVIGGDAVGGRKVTARFRDVPLEEALDALAEAAGLNYTMRRGIIILTGSDPVLYSNSYPGNVDFSANSFLTPTVQPGTGYAFGGTPPGMPYGNLTHPVSPSQFNGGPGRGFDSDAVEVVPISNRSAEEMMGLIPEALPQLSTLTFMRPDRRTNSLVLAGTRGAVEATKDIIRALDVREVDTRPVILFKLHFFEKAGALPEEWFKGLVSKTAPADPNTRITVLPAGDGVESLVKRVLDSGGQLSSNPVLTTLDDVPAELTISRGGNNVQNFPDGRNPNAFKVTLVPTVNTDDSITLKLDFTEMNASSSSSLETLDSDAERRRQNDHANEAMGGLVRRVQQNQILALMRPRRTTQSTPSEGSLLLVSVRLENPSPASAYLPPSNLGAAPPNSR